MNLTDPDILEFAAAEKHVGTRLDICIAEFCSSLSRTQIRREITAGNVLVDGKRAKPAYRLVLQQQVCCRFQLSQPDGPLPEPMELSILYEDDTLAVIDKPAAMVVHPAKGHWQGTLVSGLAAHFESLSNVGGSIRPGIVHRLDRDTTGVIIIAKTDDAHRKLAHQFETRSVEKQYVCLCLGSVDRDRDTIDLPIGHHPYNRVKMAIRHDGGNPKNATTFYEVIERFRRISYVRVRPKTGRTHQIRVHIAHVGNPVLCDRLYGSMSNISRSFLLTGRDDLPESERDILLTRQALHAESIEFNHPISAERMQVSAPLPKDMSGVLEALRAGA
ncbi:MAG: RluA family pseudouridine synthase [Planctomycetaceae bacterium]|jgi:23S rRNA pseudouridine1911/1915/1917 synthase|nr:RluA family pseudouridine synthase [Planctomycetaceae bacterium]